MITEAQTLVASIQEVSSAAGGAAGREGKGDAEEAVSDDEGSDGDRPAIADMLDKLSSAHVELDKVTADRGASLPPAARVRLR